jgi:hypothetical protein
MNWGWRSSTTWRTTPRRDTPGVMSGYLSRSALEELAKAQAELERHLVTGSDGRCRGCGGVEPCRARERLEAVFALYGRLPRRRPGATKAGLRRPESTDTHVAFHR